MRTIELAVLRNRLEEYVRIAQAGERVRISEGGRVVAEVAPPGFKRAEADPDVVLGSLVRMGIVTPPLTSGRGLTVEHPRGSRLADVLAEVAGDRADR